MTGVAPSLKGGRNSARALVAARRRIVELGRDSVNSVAFRRDLRSVLSSLLAFDGYCVNTADPATLLVTGSVGDGLPSHSARRFFEIELLEPDFSKLQALAVSDTNVAVLGDETGSCPEKSARMREVLMPCGYGFELRCALMLGGCCWGYLHLLRASGGVDFSRTEAELIRTLSVDIAMGLRAGVLRDAKTHTNPAGLGMLLLAPDGRSVDSINAAAEHWLGEFRDELSDPLPHSVLAVAQQARSSAPCSQALARSRVQTKAGEWLTLHATPIGDHLAVVIERTRPEEIAPVLLRAYELTERERGVVQLLLRGRSNDEIAVALNLSTYTVKQHLKSVFRKLGAASRTELSARFYSEQQPAELAAASV